MNCRSCRSKATNPWFAHQAFTKVFLGKLHQSFPSMPSNSRYLSRAIRSLQFPGGISEVPLNQKGYFSSFPLVGDYFIHQPFIVFSLAKVIVGMSLMSRRMFIVI